MNTYNPDVLPFQGDSPTGLMKSDTAFAEVMYSINADHQVSRDIARQAMHEVLVNELPCRDTQLGALLMGSTKIATPDLVAGFVDAIYEVDEIDVLASKPDVSTYPDEVIVGCAGSGKKGRKTINISTPSMIVAAAAGAKTLKTGSRALSSVTGSTDILESVGMELPASDTISTRLLQETNFGFYPIERMVPNFDKVYGSKFFTPHVLSLVLPATLIPVKTDAIYYGYAGPKVGLSAQTFATIGYPSVLVCNNTKDGIRYIDEMATEGTTSIAGCVDGQVGSTRSFDAASYVGVNYYQTRPGINTKGTVEGQRKAFMDILKGRYPGSQAENTICLNAATILYLAKKFDHPREAFKAASETVRSGQALNKLEEIIEVSRDLAR